MQVTFSAAILYSVLSFLSLLDAFLQFVYFD